jgi:hypothetical protein
VPDSRPGSPPGRLHGDEHVEHATHLSTS